MNSIHRSISEPIREGLSADELWLGQDKGLLKCWELGRAWRKTKPELAARVERHELPTLPFKGGVEGAPKYEKKYGSLRYFAMLQGLSGLDLKHIHVVESAINACTCVEQQGLLLSLKKGCYQRGKSMLGPENGS